MTDWILIGYSFVPVKGLDLPEDLPHKGGSKGGIFKFIAWKFPSNAQNVRVKTEFTVCATSWKQILHQSNGKYIYITSIPQ